MLWLETRQVLSPVPQTNGHPVAMESIQCSGKRLVSARKLVRGLFHEQFEEKH
jgi:hypothetical protein